MANSIIETQVPSLKLTAWTINQLNTNSILVNRLPYIASKVLTYI